MFSHRIEWSAELNPLTEAVARRRATGQPVYDLMETNPTAAGLDYEGEAILRALANPGSMTYEPTAHGLESAREAVRDYYTKRGWRVETEQLLLTASTSEAYGLLFKLLGQPGDEVLYPTPGYPLVEFLARFEGLAAVPYRLVFEAGTRSWRIDFDRLAGVISERTRALTVISPSNPAGNYLHEEDGAILESWAATRGFALIVDEVFYDFPGTGARRTSQPSGKALTFVLNGLSKVCGLPQMKMGWIAVFGPTDLAAEAIRRLEYIADFYLSAGAPVQHAAAILLNTRHELHRQINSRLTANENYLRNRCNHSGGHYHLLPREGGWCAVLRCQDEGDATTRALHWLETYGVLAHPGYYYDLRDNGLMVVSLLTAPETFAEIGNVLTGH